MDTLKTTQPSTSGAQNPFLRLFLWAGIAGPVFFVLVFTIDGLLTPGYSTVNNAVSDLDLGSAGWIQVVNFIILSLLLILFSLGFFQWMRPMMISGWRYVITVLLVLSSVGYVIAGVFVPDPPGQSHVTVHGTLHTISFTLVFGVLAITCLITSVKFIMTSGWRIHGVYSLLTGLFLIPAPLANLGTLFTTAAPISNPSQAAFSYGGLIERGIIIIALAWFVILASRMLMRERGAVKASNQ
jgi:hypothetical membrane protein